ncbi:MAG: PBP1A family penicillin-binding protein [Candidatus Uhrbacteria bacterium]
MAYFSKKTWVKIKPWLKIGGLSVLALAVVGFFIFTLYAAWVSRELPDPNTLITRDVPQSTKIYDRTGTHLLYEVHGDERRTLVKIDEIPESVKQATISLEDRQFYEHHGVNWLGLARAVFTAVIHGQRIQGTSTLTQQLVKLAILTNERSLDRKIRELILSMQIEKRYTKDQILQLYLNEIPYGSDIYGIEAAAETYFGKPAKQLTIDESALLASIPQRPTFYSPYSTAGKEDNFYQLKRRQQYAIDTMAEIGYITKDQAEQAKAVDTLAKIKPRQVGQISAPHFVIYVRQQLEEKYGLKTVGEGGLSVITTLDWDKQLAAEDEVKKGVEARGKQYKFTNAALVSLDPKTGQVLAMVGSKDFFDESIQGQVNVAVSNRQPGSSFKPLVYAAGFARGYLPQTQLWDVETTFKTDIGNYNPHDYDGKERGPVSIRQAFAGSLNIPAVEMLYLVGIPRVLDFTGQLGYTTFGDRSRFGLSLVLGGAEVKPIEHAAAFQAFATGGDLRPVASVLKVTDSNGQTLEEWTPPEAKQVMDPQTARLVTDVMTDNAARAYVFGLNNSLTLPDRPVAAKTGTTNNFKDAWTMGFTPNLVTVVWVGNSRGEEMKSGADGSIVAAPIWQAYMKRALKGMPIERFTPPDAPQTTKLALLGKAFEEKVIVNKLTGLRASDLTPAELREERPNRIAHSILWFIDKDDPTGPAPTNPAQDPQFGNWESAVRSWATRSGWLSPTSTVSDEVDTLYTEANRPKVIISNPSEGGMITSRIASIQVEPSAPRPIVRVEAYIDNIPVGSRDGGPWTIDLRIPNRIVAGYHTLLVRAYDEIGLQGESSVNINLTAGPDATLSGLTILSPHTDDTWSRASFPKKIQISMEEPAIYSRIDISLIGSDGMRRLVGTKSLPTDANWEVSIPAGPSTGRYSVLVEGTRKGTDQKDQATLFLTVTD